MAKVITDTKEGYIAISDDGKYLKNYWVGGSQTGTNRQSLTEDISKATIKADKSELNIMIAWFNNSHKRQVPFTIKKIKTEKQVNYIIIS